jgi:hypothetical protein
MMVIVVSVIKVLINWVIREVFVSSRPSSGSSKITKEDVLKQRDDKRKSLLTLIVG